jgi:transposase
MSAMVAIKSDPHIRSVYKGLRGRGKPGKVALTAVMRKLICHLDAVARAYRARRGTQAA